MDPIVNVKIEISPHFSQILALICEWLSSLTKAREPEFEFPDPTMCPFFFPFFLSFSLSLHFFYFGDQPWHPHPHRRLIFNYGAADSRTRNTFIAAPGIDFPHGSTEIYPHNHRIVHLSRTVFRGSFQEKDSLRSFSPNENLFIQIHWNCYATLWK